MQYVVRVTLDPAADIARGWSGWQGMVYDSLADAAEDLIADLDEIWESSSFEDYGDFCVDQLHRQGLDVRMDEPLGKWRLVHHGGLSCYALDTEDEQEAWELARAGRWDGTGEAEYTIGEVRWIGEVDPEWHLHLFACERTGRE